MGGNITLATDRNDHLVDQQIEDGTSPEAFFYCTFQFVGVDFTNSHRARGSLSHPICSMPQ